MESPTSREYKLRCTWNQFARALRSPEPFNAWQWSYDLLNAGVSDLATLCGLSRQSLNPWIPLFALSLILLVLISYFLSIRHVMHSRWCSNHDTDHRHDEGHCYWMPIHDVVVSYLGSMILFHYFSAVCSSPGVCLSKTSERTWTAKAGQGGLWGYNVSLDRAREKQRVEQYNILALREISTEKSTRLRTKETENPVSGSAESPGCYFPSPATTFCLKCQIVRPPRCHHCSQCQRCVLQFDHHCIWVNNCIGYNN